ncbi:MAG: ABC transporter ATP-binding protein [bacterium]|nr:ABC transporter ATP-binding protein [bacterium]
MSMVLHVEGLRVAFGRKPVLQGLDLELEPGLVTVLLGQNGSGKSTLIRVLLGVRRPQGGSVRLLGLNPLAAHREALERVGYVPDVPDVYPWMTARDLFRFLEPQYRSWNRSLCRDLCERLDVPLRTKFKAMSRGQGMKAMLVAALAPDPDLLLLDEPFAGLDPLVREQVLEGVVDALEVGERTVLCATHELDVAARIADRVAVLESGRIVQHGSLAEVLGEEEPAQVPSRLHEVLAAAAIAEEVLS